MDNEKFKFYAETITANWDRAIFVDDLINDAMVQKLAPQILRFRQQSRAPITVAVDSLGGSVASLEALLGLLQGPDQQHSGANFIAVVTHRACSAAADLVAFSDYSVAYPHSQILFHDVRFSALDDVTSQKAQLTARELGEASERFSHKLADRIVRRMMWNYIDRQSQFIRDCEKYPKTCAMFKKQLEPHLDQTGTKLNFLGFAVSLFAGLSRENDQLIWVVLDRLGRWIEFERLESVVPTHRVKGSRKPGLLDGIDYLYGQFRRQMVNSEHDTFHLGSAAVSDLKLFMSICARRLAEDKSGNANFARLLDTIGQDFFMIKSMTNPKHVKTILQLMLEREHMFFTDDLLAKLKGANSEEDRTKILTQVFPAARLFWYFVVLVCRALFDGEHWLSPKDAQLLGIVDEITGGGPIQSQREFAQQVQEKDNNAAKQQPAVAVPEPGGTAPDAPAPSVSEPSGSRAAA